MIIFRNFRFHRDLVGSQFCPRKRSERIEVRPHQDHLGSLGSRKSHPGKPDDPDQDLRPGGALLRRGSARSCFRRWKRMKESIFKNIFIPEFLNAIFLERENLF
jgi:hypothetical protein